MEIALETPEAAAMKPPEPDFDRLIRPMESRMMRSIWRIVHQREAAEDALQDALTAVWKKRAAVVRHPNPEAFILRISINAAYDILRKDRRRLLREVAAVADRNGDPRSDSVPEEVEARGLRARVLEAIGRLPRKQATAALLRLVEERSYAEIAGSMDCSEATARVHVMRARAALARRLGCGRPRPEGAEADKEKLS
jgi:RNA polymerase sigma factor (sigma-70 family)